MNYWKHSLLSRKKFGGNPEDYLPVHKFLDSSKLFYYHLKHRILLHNTYGMEICISKFGELVTNSDGKKILVRDIVAEHCKEDLFGIVPTLINWFKYADEKIFEDFELITTDDQVLNDFLMKPLMMSGLQSSLIITHSNFGIYLAKEVLGSDYALKLSKLVENKNINELLQYIKLKEKWEFTPNMEELKQMNDEHI
ncbi:hypothetical protein SAMN05421796_10673 [Chryseobacterium piscicola]|uniref:DUF6915 domain-containing protein n=1 Tax=Chryseobacterium piscicola TaxID=551459 RepID=A0A1N7N096_9FLAO|nr:hypothetical protein [Chryseobacterium piscicola]PQA93857.1 hypothetical protein B0A70_08715 [Chryseobacterium piscicola]SIS91698.1 hypothetical protein SAMN05421796_10673 [Chryseobacterium piscicola]